MSHKNNSSDYVEKEEIGVHQTGECTANLDWCSDRYVIEGKVGEGTFSVVYRARDIHTNAKVAIKAIIRTTASSRILDELKVLNLLQGQSHCIPLLDVLRKADQILAVFPLINSIDFKEFITQADKNDIKYYMVSLLQAVRHVHENGYIHRDIKPSNFLYDMEQRIGFLIDFGLVQEMREFKTKPREPERTVLFFNSTIKPHRPPGYFENDTRPKMRAARAGTRGFRAPEILFKYANQGPEIDVWSVGIIFLSILSAQYPFFMSIEDIDGLVEIATIFGHSEMRKAARQYGRVWKCNLDSISEERVEFKEIIEHMNSETEIDADALDLLNKMLELDNTKRITAKEALQHRFFSR